MTICGPFPPIWTLPTRQRVTIRAIFAATICKVRQWTMSEILDVFTADYPDDRAKSYIVKAIKDRSVIIDDYGLGADAWEWLTDAGFTRYVLPISTFDDARDPALKQIAIVASTAGFRSIAVWSSGPVDNVTCADLLGRIGDSDVIPLGSIVGVGY
jgi:hypothetical protein